jgi:hypothetical protein
VGGSLNGKKIIGVGSDVAYDLKIPAQRLAVAAARAGCECERERQDSLPLGFAGTAPSLLSNFGSG